MRTKIVSLLLFAIFITSCNSGYNNKSIASSNEKLEYLPETDDMMSSEMSYSSKDKKEAITNETNKEDDNAEIEKKIIKTANISFGVSDYKKSKSKISKVIAKQKAYISSESENNSSYSISNTIIIRVPAENFEKLLTDLEGEADEFESKSINTSDVTEEYVDILSRLKNKKKVEAQYIQLLKKARTIAEILEVNEHIRRLREEIEAKEGRLRYLKNQVGLSTIRLYMHQDYDTVSYGFFHKISKALSGGWNGFLSFIIGLLYIWPFLIALGVAIYFVRKAIIIRHKRKK